ncbi:hypothetical protein KKE78_00195 [Patescibacteria group bacterium]|nr:hypothetical protein [Patescibacteria group bacterium]
MEDSRWFRLIAIGLILVALAAGYFLLSGRLSPDSAVKTTSQTTEVTPDTTSAAPSVTDSEQDEQVAPTAIPEQTSLSAYDRIAIRNQNQVQTLPKTGYPQVAAGILSVGVMISGWGLRKYPH